MKYRLTLIVTILALAFVGCAKSASVEGEGNRKLTLVKPGAVTVHRGGMAKADVKIAREGFTGEVTIVFKNLPKGVSVVEADKKIIGDEGSYTLQATADADLVENFVADVTASARPGDISVSQTISISVKEKE